MMKICDVVLAEETPTPALPRSQTARTGEGGLLPIGEVMYQYVVAGNGLFIRAEDSRIEACVLIAAAHLNGLAEIEPYARLKVDRVPGIYLHSVLASAIRHMPNEAMYQFVWDGQAGEVKPAVRRTWRCVMPGQMQTPTAVEFDDDGASVIDLHSHNSMPAFFSSTDDADEGGLRFYAVIGRLGTWQPEIRVRVGVYGHHGEVPAETVFEGLGPFVDRYGVDSDPSESDQSPEDDELVVSPMWACALYAKAKDGIPEIISMLIAAKDDEDARQAALDEAKFVWPGYKGYSGHAVAVTYAHD